MKTIALAMARWCAILCACCFVLPCAATYTVTQTIVTSGTAVKLSAVQLSATSYIVTARNTNTGVIYLGGSNVKASTQTGTPLNPGDSSGWFPISSNSPSGRYDLNLVYVDSTASGDTVSVTYVN